MSQTCRQGGLNTNFLHPIYNVWTLYSKGISTVSQYLEYTEIAKANKRQATKTYLSVWGFKEKGNMHKWLLFQNELKLWGERYTNRHQEEKVRLIYRREIYMGNSHRSSDNLYAKTYEYCLGNKPAISDSTDTLVGNTTSDLWFLPTHTWLRGMSKKKHCHRESFFPWSSSVKSLYYYVMERKS